MITLKTAAAPPRALLALLAFLKSEGAGGLALIAAAAAALIWSNSPAAPAYASLLTTPAGIEIGPHRLMLTLGGWVNNFLMALFFLAVALEIRRELIEGALASPRRAAAPILAAIGGMAVPAVIFAGMNLHNPQALHGWAIPVATDIAFALAALSVLGGRVPVGLKVFLTALAIIDDLGAILIIAVFYTSHLDPAALAEATACWLVLFGLNRADVRVLAPYLFGGLVLWVLVLRAGIHPTIAGVALAFVIPLNRAGSCPAHRLEAALGPYVTWIVLPLFGLANAGLSVGAISRHTLTEPLVLGTALGLVLGKQLGVFGATALAIRLRLAKMPAGLTWPHLYGVAVLCGIGFTMSLFIADLSFRGSPLHADAKLAVFAASLASAAFGLVILGLATMGGRRRADAGTAPTPGRT